MSIKNCPNCDKFYNLSSRRPKQLKCGHTTCSHCILDSLKVNPVYCCTVDQEIDNRDFDEISYDANIIEYLE